jgi:hypothetical protein
MRRHLSFCVWLWLAMGPHLAFADILPATGLTPTAPSPTNGFVSLFRSPAQPRPAPTESPSAAGPPLAIVAARELVQHPGRLISAGEMCRAALAAAEARYGIPTGILQAIGVVESGRRDEATGRREPWPWTINAEGEPHVFDAKAQAVDWVRQAQARGMRSIDVGCGQVNLMHHPTAFASLDQAFDPVANADYAGRFLKELHDASAGGDWLKAVGYYHSQTPELAEPYRQQVQVALSGLAGPYPAVRSRGSDPTPPFGGSGYLHSVTPSRSEPAPAVLTAAPGAAGRGLDAYRAAPIRMARILPSSFFRFQR